MLESLARTRTGPFVLLVETWLPAALEAALTRRTLLNRDCPPNASRPALRFEELGLELRYELWLSSLILPVRCRVRLVGVGDRALDLVGGAGESIRGV